MSIKENFIKIKGFLHNKPTDDTVIYLSELDKEKTPFLKRFFVLLLFILVALTSFGLGKLSVVESNKQPVTIEYLKDNQEIKNTQTASVIDSIPTQKKENSVVASKSGTKYYFLGCSGVKKILDKNKVYFSSEEEARLLGLTLASNCSK